MNYRKWARWVLVLGIFSLAVSLIYYFGLGKQSTWTNLIWQLIPSLLLIVLGIWGPRILGMVQHFPEPVACPRCKNLTDQTPCGHCGYNFLTEEASDKGNKSPNGQNWIKFGVIVFGGVALLWLIHVSVFRLYPMYTHWQNVASMQDLSQCSTYQKKGELWQQRWQRSEMAKALWRNQARKNLYHLLLCSVVNGDGIGLEVYLNWWQRGWGRQPASKRQPAWLDARELRTRAGQWSEKKCHMYDQLRQGPLPRLPELKACKLREGRKKGR